MLLRRIYDWCIEAAGKRHASWIMGALSFRAAYVRYVAWIILLKRVTPIPYKIVTITSGFAEYPILPFVLLSIVARGMRFYFFAFLLHRYGVWARVNIEKRLGLWFTIGVLVVLAGVIAATRLFYGADPLN